MAAGISGGANALVLGRAFESGTSAAIDGFRFLPGSGTFGATGTIYAQGYRA
jgi:hypothetical protein